VFRRGYGRPPTQQYRANLINENRNIEQRIDSYAADADTKALVTAKRSSWRLSHVIATLEPKRQQASLVVRP